MKIQQIRNATMVIDYGGTRFLIDPLFSDKGDIMSLPSFDYQDVKNPMVELPLTPEEIMDGVDAVILTHSHLDHWDSAAAGELDKNILFFVQDLNDKEIVEKEGFKNVKVADKREVIGDVTLTRRPTKHYVNEETKEVLAELTDGVTDVMGLVFQADNEPTLYLAADTIYFEGVKETIDTYEPEVIILNAGGNTFKIDDDRENGRLLVNEEEVYKVHQDAPEATIVASHLDAINHITTSRESIRKIGEEKGFSDQLLVPEDGETIEIS